MFKRIRSVSLACALAVLLPGLTAAPTPVLSEEMKDDAWGMVCNVDKVDHKRDCILLYMTVLPDLRPITYVELGFSHSPDGRLIFDVWMEGACRDKTVVLRVDKNPAVTFPPERDGQVSATGDQATALLKQFETGDRVLIHVWPLPDCLSKDVAVTLQGFTDAWKTFEAATKA